MSDNIEAKRLRDEAGQLYEQAKTIMAEFQGKEIPKEKSDQVDNLLDEVEAKTEAARKLEEKSERGARMAQHEKFFNDPATRKEFFKQGGPGGQEVKVAWGGRELSEDEIAEIKAMAPFPHFLKAASLEYARAMTAYARRGLGGLTGEQLKALSAGDATAGGYLQQDTYVNAFLVKQREVSAMRRMATVLPPVPSGSAIAPAEDSFLSDAAWTGENGTGSEDTVQPFGQRRLTPHPLAKRIKVSNTLLRNPLFDVEAFVRDRLSYKHGIAGEEAYVNGDGVQKPKGLLSSVGTAAGQIPAWTTATSLQVYGNDIINWIYKLPQGYASRARILCNRSFLRKIRTLETPKSGTTFTNYLWQPGLAGGQPNSILDIPYEISDRFPTGLDGSDAFTANAIVAVVGDFSYYWIADALQMSIQRLVELYAETNQTGYIGRMETDGMVVLGEAFYALKVKA